MRENFPSYNRLFHANVITAMHGQPFVLLVQPHLDTREMYSEFLHAQGVPVVNVGTAGEALRVAPKAAAIVTAMQLPGSMDGLQLIAKLRDDRSTKHTRIVVLATNALAAERARAEKAGCDVFLLVPCLPGELLTVIGRLTAIRCVNAG